MRNDEKEKIPLDPFPPDAVLQPELFPLLPQALVQKLAVLPVLRGVAARHQKPEAAVRSETKRSGAA